MLFIQEVANIVESQNFLLRSKQSPIVHLLTDSRKIAFPEQSLFFAIKGERHNGHHYIDELYKQGIQNFVIEEPIAQYQKYRNANIIQVTNSIEALQKIAIYHRQQYDYTTIGIVGSNGKTIIKEWLAHLLANHYKIVKSPKSYNSQIGVPLSVWQMNEWHNLAIFEAGTSQAGEIEKLAPIIASTIGIFTNIGTAHSENFGSLQNKIDEKLKLFEHCPTIIYCKDYPLLEQTIQEKFNQNTQLISWSRTKGATVHIQKIETNAKQTDIKLQYQKHTYHFSLPFTDAASIENATHCIVTMLYLSISEENINKSLLTLKKPSMRLELKQGIHNSYLIDDTYNNDKAGLQVALDFLNQQQQKNTHILILSDLPEAVQNKSLLYEEIAQLVQKKGIQEFIGIGTDLLQYQHFFTNQNCLFYENAAEFLQQYDFRRIANATVLIKGARKFEFEQIVKRLEYKIHGTVLEVNLDSLAHNLNFYRSLLNTNTKLMVMVKAFAYGSGSAEIAHFLQFHRVDYLTVAYPDEGVFLRENGIHLPIMVLNSAEESFDAMLRYDLEPEIYSFKILKEYLNFYDHQWQKEPHFKAKIHLKLDTGMHRLGFMAKEEEEITKLMELLAPYIAKGLEIKTVFSHLAAADQETNDAYTRQQIQLFEHTTQRISETLQIQFWKHLLNSAGIVRFQEAHYDMVRLGVGLYGVESGSLFQSKLETIGTLKTIISQIKHIKTGETVGYGRKGVAINDMRIATIAIGYADGYNRKFSQGVGKVFIQGKYAPVIGNVCMDMTMVDITGIDAKEGDEVIVFGKEVSIIEMAKAIDTIAYELLTNISDRVKRVFYTN
ncbi:MAG: bifunctional UDP-N-acetylmuramoyl-tripeptide:D-alanyl-D-alanine ligase/alanine racemase [Cytophagales bacterium]|nr:MAG: bifunctional UDP-N-acetylmuramoyl-tripeptide:D-alanyl-D-alanine ligase/alanine racemase [Cytophagales bacterium]